MYFKKEMWNRSDSTWSISSIHELWQLCSSNKTLWYGEYFHGLLLEICTISMIELSLSSGGQACSSYFLSSFCFFLYYISTASLNISSFDFCLLLSTTLWHSLPPTSFFLLFSKSMVNASQCSVTNSTLMVNNQTRWKELAKLSQSIRKMYCSHWKHAGVSDRMRSVNIDASIVGEYVTLGGYSCQSSE